VAASPLLFAVIRADEAPKQAKSITVSELSKLQVIGALGQALGKIIVIEGVAADEYYRKMKADGGHTLLRVQSVDGKKLQEEQVFHFLAFPSADIEKPKVGSKFKYIGYETGAFTGVPAKAFDYTLPVATTGYGFTTDFVVVRDEMKQK